MALLRVKSCLIVIVALAICGSLFVIKFFDAKNVFHVTLCFILFNKIN